MQHHIFRKNKKILVITKDGEYIIGKFKESKSKYIVLVTDEKKEVKIHFSNIRSSTIYNQSNERKT